MGDAKDILGLPKVADRSDTPKSSDKRRQSKDSQRKPDGVSREVYSLIGGLPPIMTCLPDINVKKHLQQPVHPDRKKGWRWVPISSSARKDNLELHHWEQVDLEKEPPDFERSDSSIAEGSGSIAPIRPQYKVAARPPTDYVYAKYNRTVDIVRYTDEEYAQYLEDENWTREQTDQLFDLCEQLDLRFIVIADRFPDSRTPEELKDRYYNCAKKILESRVSSPDEVAQHPLVKNAYNFEHEVERKKSLELLLSQTRRQERKDHEILEEAQRIREERFKQRKAEKASRAADKRKQARMEVIAEVENTGDLTREGGTSDALLGTSGSPTLKTAEEGEAGSPKVPTRPRRPAMRNQASHASTSVEAPATSCPSQDTQERSMVPGESNVAKSLTKKVQGVYLLSTHHAKAVQEYSSQAGQRASRRINQMLEKYKCPPKVKQFTKRVCDMHLEVREHLLALVKLEEEIQLREAEIRTAKTTNKGTDKTSPSTPRRSQRVTAAVVGAESNTSSGERVSKREKRRSVRTIEQ
ncbi:DNA methyltransferase 1-associated protein 1 [Marchantia polymorpha subsp. ruderalis]|nr:hypothetical protein MARPO_0092s0082 [Marchantia polymorpha]BBN11478.1 hypothetical protein Mp_5g12220 [Marchantia polymorpha subsp. ruderalis]|eukprot:PTQ33121.1 hypothetical protein MARPO_0092s0082 [Marchantia polymorpha]